MRPVDDAATYVPLVHSVKLDIIPHRQRHAFGQVQVVAYEHDLPCPRFQDEALVRDSLAVVVHDPDQAPVRSDGKPRAAGFEGAGDLTVAPFGRDLSGPRRRGERPQENPGRRHDGGGWRDRWYEQDRSFLPDGHSFAVQLSCTFDVTSWFQRPL